MLTLGEFFYLLNKTLPRCAEAAETLHVSWWMCQTEDSGEQGEGSKVWGVGSERGRGEETGRFAGHLVGACSLAWSMGCSLSSGNEPRYLTSSIQ